MNKPGIGTIYTLSPCINCNNTLFKQIDTIGLRFKCTYCGVIHALNNSPGIVSFTGIKPDRPLQSITRGISPK